MVRGLQLGVGLNLAQKGVSLVWFKDAKVGVMRDLSGSDSLFLGIFGAIFILLTVLPYEKLELPAASTIKQPAEELEVPQQGPDEVEGQTPTIVGRHVYICTLSAKLQGVHAFIELRSVTRIY